MLIANSLFVRKRASQESPEESGESGGVWNLAVLNTVLKKLCKSGKSGGVQKNPEESGNDDF